VPGAAARRPGCELNATPQTVARSPSYARRAGVLDSPCAGPDPKGARRPGCELHAETPRSHLPGPSSHDRRRACRAGDASLAQQEKLGASPSPSLGATNSKGLLSTNVGTAKEYRRSKPCFSRP